jgi:hypothetical protein
MATGDMLLEAKDKLVPRGKWLGWPKEHCGIPDRTARLYMRLANNRAVIEAMGDVADLTLNAATRLLASPQDDDEIDEKADDVQEEAAAEINIEYAEAELQPADNTSMASNGKLIEELHENLQWASFTISEDGRIAEIADYMHVTVDQTHNNNPDAEPVYRVTITMPNGSKMFCLTFPNCGGSILG